MRSSSRNMVFLVDDASGFSKQTFGTSKTVDKETFLVEPKWRHLRPDRWVEHFNGWAKEKNFCIWTFGCNTRFVGPAKKPLGQAGNLRRTFFWLKRNRGKSLLFTIPINESPMQYSKFSASLWLFSAWPCGHGAHIARKCSVTGLYLKLSSVWEPTQL